MKTKTRPPWDEYFLELAEVVKRRADCIRGTAAAIIVKDHRIISTGYNGTPNGIKNCSQEGCIRCQKRKKGEIQRYQFEESCVCIHAEQNAIIQAAYLGTSTRDATMYITLSPCSTCAKMIINSGIRKVVFQELHHDENGPGILEKAGIEIVVKR